MPPPNRSEALLALSLWIMEKGVQGVGFDELLEGLSRQLLDAGIPVLRVNTAYRALHPVFGAVSHRWHKHRGTEREIFTRSATPSEMWLKSPIYHMLDQNVLEFRADPTDPATQDRFPVLGDFHKEGATDYFVLSKVFGPNPERSVENPGEGLTISVTSDAPGGFSDQDITDLKGLLPVIAISLHAGSNRQMTVDLLSVYLGEDASLRVMSGEIDRGSTEEIGAVVLLYDLSGFTKLSETLDGPDIIEMLNSYFGMVVREVEQAGGNVLKFMGDGMLAVFAHDPEAEAGRIALDSIQAIRRGMQTLNAERAAAGLTTTGCTMALHAGDVLYGNIGGETRLDFTVIGPAVNTTARIAGMCDPLDQRVVVSDRVARPWVDKRADLVSLGAYRLRGVTERVELYTLD